MLATIAVVGATHHIGIDAVVLTAAFGIGVGIPLLVLALAGDALARRTGLLRRRAKGMRIASGVIMVLVAAAIGFNLTDGLQRHVPGYTSALQSHFENNSQLHDLTTGGHKATGPAASAACAEGAKTLVNCGTAPDFRSINGWLNTPGDKPLSLAGLQGKVVLVDFWTYSCINCQRTLPYLEAWYRTYHSAGLDIVGVHTPEFAFEHVTSNIREQAAALGVKYPIAIDNAYGTWNAYGNQYWPAEYLIDSTGQVRHISFGEGGYADTEKLIRQLLAAAKPGRALATAPTVKATAPTGTQTPETYLGYNYPLRVTGPKPTHNKAASYTFPATLKQDTFALSWQWTSGGESLKAGSDAKLELSYQAHKVFLVLGGTGTVTVRVGADPPKTIKVSGVPRLYTLASSTTDARAQLDLGVSPGVEAYDFTFG